MLQIKNLNMVHKRDLHVILTDFQFVLNPGEKAVMIGEEGNGKSTLLKWIYDPQLVEDYAEASGERICDGEILGYLPQELGRTDGEKTIYEFFSEAPGFFEQTPRELGGLAGELGLSVEFFYGEQRMKSLSGGEKVKAQMARLLLAGPSVLLLDEPSNDIDIETLEWLERFLRGTDRSVLFISHDETLIERTANVVIHLEQIRRKTVSRYTVARMPYQEYLRQRSASFKNQEQNAQNERRQEKIRQEKFRRIQQRVEQEQAAVSRQDPHSGQLLKKKMKAVISMGKRFQREAAQMTRMPEQEEAIFFRFGEEEKLPAGKMVLDFALEELRTAKQGEEGEAPRVLARNISLQVKGREKICIVGKNGAGKTTLLRQIAGELLERKDLHAAYMPQNYEDLLDMEKNPVDYLAVTGAKEERTRIRTYLGSLKYTAEEMGHPIRELSGGQKAKLLLLRISLSGANVLLLDEPTRNFSPLSNPVIREVLSDFGGAIISISHDRKYIEEVCDTVYRLTEEGLTKII